MTSQRLEVLALLYANYSGAIFAYKGKKGSACQMLYQDYADNPYRQLLGMNKDTQGTNLKGEFVLWNLICKSNFVGYVKTENHFDKEIAYYKLSEEGQNIGRLICSKEPQNIELAKQTTKKYEGSVEELPKEFYMNRVTELEERNYFLGQKIKEFQAFIKLLKDSGLAEVAKSVSEKIKEYKV